jgi:hypothetical protein
MKETLNHGIWRFDRTEWQQLQYFVQMTSDTSIGSRLVLESTLALGDPRHAPETIIETSPVQKPILHKKIFLTMIRFHFSLQEPIQISQTDKGMMIRRHPYLRKKERNLSFAWNPIQKRNLWINLYFMPIVFQESDWERLSRTNQMKDDARETIPHMDP